MTYFIVQTQLDWTILIHLVRAENEEQAKQLVQPYFIEKCVSQNILASLGTISNEPSNNVTEISIIQES